MLTIVVTGLCFTILTLFGPLPQQLRQDRAQYAWVVVALTMAVAIINKVVTDVHYARKAKSLGCEDAPGRQAKLPLSIDLVYEMLKADKEDIVPEKFVMMAEQVGKTTFRNDVLGATQFFTTEPKNIQAVLATQFNDFEIGSLRRNVFYPLLGDGIFTADGKFWEHSRALLRPQFARDQVSDLELEEFHFQDLLKHLPTSTDGWTAEIDLSPLFFRLTLDSATEFLFGQSVDSQVAALPVAVQEQYRVEGRGYRGNNNMGASFDYALHHIGMQFRFAELYWVYRDKEYNRHCREVHKFADHYVKLALSTDLDALDEKQKQETKTNGKPKYVFLRELVKATRDPIELRCQLLHILLAGRDTTAGLLGWTFWYLVRDPAVYAKLRSAILDDFGSFDSPRNITFETLKSCTYLKYVLNEALRLQPSVPLNSRRATKDTTIPVGGGPDGLSPVFIRKGTEVSYNVKCMHLRTDLWGPDAKQFRPDRWIGRKTGWEFLPFNGGPRLCLGQQFALTEAAYVVVRLVQKFDRLEDRGPVETIPKHQYSVTSAPKQVKVRLHAARD